MTPPAPSTPTTSTGAAGPGSLSPARDAQPTYRVRIPYDLANSDAFRTPYKRDFVRIPYWEPATAPSNPSGISNEIPKCRRWRSPQARAHHFSKKRLVSLPAWPDTPGCPIHSRSLFARIGGTAHTSTRHRNGAEANPGDPPLTPPPPPASPPPSPAAAPSTPRQSRKTSQHRSTRCAQECAAQPAPPSASRAPSSTTP